MSRTDPRVPADDPNEAKEEKRRYYREYRRRRRAEGKDRSVKYNGRVTTERSVLTRLAIERQGRSTTK